MTQFKLKRPCSDCPFRSDRHFHLSHARFVEILHPHSMSFQCHNTVDYDHFEDPIARQGDKPQQCAGRMILLMKEGRPDAIMQVGERMGYFDPSQLEMDAPVYGSVAECLSAHEND